MPHLDLTAAPENLSDTLQVARSVNALNSCLYGCVGSCACCCMVVDKSCVHVRLLQAVIHIIDTVLLPTQSSLNSAPAPAPSMTG